MLDDYLYTKIKCVAYNSVAYSTAKMCRSQNLSYTRCVVSFWLTIGSPFWFAQSATYNSAIWTYWTHTVSLFFRDYFSISHLSRSCWPIDRCPRLDCLEAARPRLNWLEMPKSEDLTVVSLKNISITNLN
jgi:hypothetical protein